MVNLALAYVTTTAFRLRQALIPIAMVKKKRPNITDMIITLPLLLIVYNSFRFTITQSSCQENLERKMQVTKSKRLFKIRGNFLFEEVPGV